MLSQASCKRFAIFRNIYEVGEIARQSVQYFLHLTFVLWSLDVSQANEAVGFGDVADGVPMSAVLVCATTFRKKYVDPLLTEKPRSNSQSARRIAQTYAETASAGPRVWRNR